MSECSGMDQTPQSWALFWLVAAVWSSDVLAVAGTLGIVVAVPAVFFWHAAWWVLWAGVLARPLGKCSTAWWTAKAKALR